MSGQSDSDKSDADDESDPLFGGELAFDPSELNDRSESSQSSAFESSDDDQPTHPKKRKRGTKTATTNAKSATTTKPTKNEASYKVFTIVFLLY